VRKLGSVGPALPGVEVAILDDADGALPAPALRHSWLHTGDTPDRQDSEKGSPLPGLTTIRRAFF